ncbi:synaptogyrin-2-like [Asterias amurensis]|uniref:synaptogyrin-2-like n=1 Tax=Asterias amurensis TaxID=7602 RepID=UPI003AB1920E
METGAYGAGRASSAGFDHIAFVKKPQVILRAVAWLFAIIVFGCISNKGFDTRSGQCVFNNDTNACNFGVTVGVVAFLACMAFLVVDALFDNMSNVQYRKYAVLGDLAFSGFWLFMWFVCFCYLADAWRKMPRGDVIHFGQPKAAIAFSFFSLVPWTGLTILAFMRYRQGSQAAFSQNYEPDPNMAQSGMPGGQSASDSYQQPPFAEKSSIPDSQFQTPTY